MGEQNTSVIYLQQAIHEQLPQKWTNCMSNYQQQTNQNHDLYMSWL